MSYLNANDWQLKEIREALKEADAGDFATKQALDTLTNKWKVQTILPINESTNLLAPLS